MTCNTFGIRYTVESPNNGHVGAMASVRCRESSAWVTIFLRMNLLNALSIYRIRPRVMIITRTINNLIKPENSRITQENCRKTRITQENYLKWSTPLPFWSKFSQF